MTNDEGVPCRRALVIGGADAVIDAAQRRSHSSFVIARWRGGRTWKQTGFTLIELMVVLAIVAIGTALTSLALRDGSADALARDGERLAALLETARAQSRAAGVPVRWHPTVDGFAFEGLSAAAPLPRHWLDAQTMALGNAQLVLGPDPVIGPQAVLLRRRGDDATPPLRIATDGLRPFAVMQAAP